MKQRIQQTRIYLDKDEDVDRLDTTGTFFDNQRYPTHSYDPQYVEIADIALNTKENAYTYVIGHSHETLHFSRSHADVNAVAPLALACHYPFAAFSPS